MKKFTFAVITLTVCFTSSVVSFAQTSLKKPKGGDNKQNTSGAVPKGKPGKNGFTVLPAGVSYKIIHDEPGKNISIGEFADCHITIMADTMHIRSSRAENGGQPVTIPVNSASGKPDLLAALPYLSAGDSAVINVSMDTIMAGAGGQQLPPFFKKGHNITFLVTVVKVKSAEENQKEMDARQSTMDQMAKDQVAKDDQALQDYFKTNGIKANKTSSGLYYVIDKDGQGPNIAKGQKVSVNYTGKLLNGKMFDSNTDPSRGHLKPFDFKAGAGNVIQGWDEGVTLMKKGTKATLFIPSGLGYGPRAMGQDIPAFSILVFDMEILDVTTE